MNQVKKTIIGFLIGIGIYGIIIEVLGVCIFPKKLAFSLGLLLGICGSIFLIMHITFTLDKALDMGEQQATKYIRKQALLRLFVMLIIMIIALKFEYFYFVATILGLLGLKIGSFIAAPILKKIYPDDFITKFEDESEEDVKEVIG